jgi:hypothetical protein
VNENQEQISKKEDRPNYWHLLSSEDQKGYANLQKTVSAPWRKNRPNRSLQTFEEIFESIKSFVVRSDADDWKRSTVCGIRWIASDQYSGVIAINARQLGLLISKCKSSINGSFQRLGYGFFSAEWTARCSSTNCSLF